MSGKKVSKQATKTLSTKVSKKVSKNIRKKKVGKDYAVKKRKEKLERKERK